MSTVTITVSVINGTVSVSPNPADVKVGDTLILSPDDGVTIESFSEKLGSNNVFSVIPSSSNNWTGTISTGDYSGEIESYTINANGISHDPKIRVNS